MNQFKQTLYALALCFFTMTISAQISNEHISYTPHNDTFTIKSPTPSPKNDTAERLDNNANVARLISASYLNPADGFIGLVFSDKIKEPNIYYKIVDNAGREVYNGSAHAAVGTSPTLYYNTENLPSGKYRVFVENADFFLSTTYIK